MPPHRWCWRRCASVTARMSRRSSSPRLACLQRPVSTPAARTTGCSSCLTSRRHCAGEDVRKVDIRPSVHACAYSILGRCLARQQNFAKAAEAFEQSVQIAHQVRTTFPSPAHAQLCNAKDQGAVAHPMLQNCSTGTSCWSCSRCVTSSSGSCRFAKRAF